MGQYLEAVVQVVIQEPPVHPVHRQVVNPGVGNRGLQVEPAGYRPAGSSHYYVGGVDVGAAGAPQRYLHRVGHLQLRGGDRYSAIDGDIAYITATRHYPLSYQYRVEVPLATGGDEVARLGVLHNRFLDTVEHVVDTDLDHDAVQVVVRTPRRSALRLVDRGWRVRVVGHPGRIHGWRTRVVEPPT